MKPIPKPTKADRKKRPKNHTVKKKRASISKLIKEADRLFSLYTRARDKGSLYSGVKENCQCAHLVSRGYYKYRFDPRNSITLTYAEHIHGWHSGKMGEYIFWLKNTYPEKFAFFEMAVADVHQSTNKRPNAEELEKIIEGLKKLLESVS